MRTIPRAHNEPQVHKIPEREDTGFKPFSVVDYLNTTDLIKNLILTGPEKGAQQAAAVKRLKSGIAMRFLLKIGEVENLDITPTMALKIIKKLTQKGVCKQTLLLFFAVEGRKACDKTKDMVLVDDIVEKYQSLYNQYYKRELKMAEGTAKDYRPVKIQFFTEVMKKGKKLTSEK